MCKAIAVKFIPATNFRLARLKAFDSTGNSVTVEYDSLDGEGETKYQNAAEKLKQKMNWQGKLVGGWLGQEAIFVFVN